MKQNNACNNPNYDQRNFYPQYPANPQQMNQGMPDTSGNKKQKERKMSKGAKALIIFAVLGLILGCGAFFLVNKYVKQITVINLPGAPILAETEDLKIEVIKKVDNQIQETVVPNNIAAPDSTIKGDTWDGKSRITCLAMGLDYRDWVENDGTPRSDTMMLLTYDPVTKEAGMLSIPRDLWVAIPNHGYGRINTAYSMGEGEKLPGVNGKPGGGPGLAMRTVELFLGIDIQYYAVVDFYGFIDFIDAIDKLAINVRDDITVDPLGQGNTVRLMAGVQDLDGATALAYARYRYTEGGDFERAQRQQDVIYAIYKQLRWQLPELMTTRFDIVFSSVQRAIKTNIPISDLIKLAWTAIEIEPSNIKRAVIAPPYQVEYGHTTDGTQDILIPIPDKIREARDSIFASSSNGVQVSEEYTAENRMRDEQARILLTNGCSDPEKVNKTIELLYSYGVQVVGIESGNYGWANTMTITNGKPYTARFLQELMNVPGSQVYMKYDPAMGSDITINLTDPWCNQL